MSSVELWQNGLTIKGTIRESKSDELFQLNLPFLGIYKLYPILLPDLTKGQEMPQVLNPPVSEEIWDLPEKIGHNVLKTLGRPPGFHSVKAIPLFLDYWRVNVWGTKELQHGFDCIDATVITDSFFVKVSENGSIIHPIFERKYY